MIFIKVTITSKFVKIMFASFDFVIMWFNSTSMKRTFDLSIDAKITKLCYVDHR